MKSTCQSYDTKLERVLKLNMHCLEWLHSEKVKLKLAPLYWYRTIKITLYAITIVLLGWFLYYNFNELPYALSAIALLSFYITAATMSLKQMIIIKRMKYSNDIITIQSSLVMLRTHGLDCMRLSVLFIPVFVAFPVVVGKAISDLGIESLSFPDILSQYKGNWWSVQVIVMIACVPFSTWFYLQVSYKNMHKKWIKYTIQKTTGSRIRKAIESLNELDSLKQDIAGASPLQPE